MESYLRVLKSRQISSPLKRVKVSIGGVVQGVGFRPFVFRLASSLGLSGYVTNLPWGVLIEAEGGEEELNKFILRLPREKPPLAHITSLEFSLLDPLGLDTFRIKKSVDEGETSPVIPPDIATCKECLNETLEPKERRHLYPFTNCTNCGPRLSIINALPYDRPNTTMKAFEMCDDCRREYDTPEDRRFHAQPIACPACGPHVELLMQDGKPLVKRDDVMERAAELLLQGKILAVKGLGGFLLVADARNERAVIELRKRKRRGEKPFALLFPSLEMTREYCEVSHMEERLLTSPESPVVLLRRKAHTDIARAVAPANPYLGVMLPYSPLHLVLSSKAKIPLIATSGNLTDEPICIENKEAQHRLLGIADFFLTHNRPITRYVDDSVTRVVLGREMIMRRARGYAPLPIRHPEELPKVIGVGADLKNTIALSLGKSVFVSQHIGDLETLEAHEAFLQTISNFTRLFDYKAEVVACDLHPDYFSTIWAHKNGTPVVPVQHHHAHIASCMMENELDGQVLGVAWDGTGYGTDGTVWGGEFMVADYTLFQRVGHLRTFRLPGSERSVKEPRRSALSVLFETFGEGVEDFSDKIPSMSSFETKEIRLLLEMIKKGINSPLTSSAGRLFDAVSSILGIRHKINFEGQGAMELEFRACEDSLSAPAYYDFSLDNGGTNKPIVIDWRPVISGIIDDINNRMDTGIVSAKFHNTLSKMILAVARKVEMERVVLSGGVFQNKFLLEKTSQELEKEGFRVYTHQRVPPNDGGISLGQVAVAGHLRRDR
ncbi:MAG: carbamoyltransferase HypF [Candidatus Brocadiales bacterium]